MLLEEEKCGCEHDHEEDECCCGRAEFWIGCKYSRQINSGKERDRGYRLGK